MSIYAYINPQLFADDGAAAAPAGGGAEAGTAAESGTAAQSVNVGDTLSDGSQVQDPQVAAAMNRRLKQHPELRDAFFGQKAKQQEPAAQPQPQGAEPTPEEWAEAKKRFAKFYGNDVHDAVKDRFKNQEDANAKLTQMQPMIDELMRTTGAESMEELQQLIMDRKAEEEAEAAGVPTEQWKRMQALEKEHEERVASDKRETQQKQFIEHVQGLRQQAEELKKMFPDFDLENELRNNEKFRVWTSPGVGMTVEEAYYAMHGKELTPQLMAYGMQRAQQQMGQTIMAQRARPAEGAMSGKNPAAAEPRINPKNLSREEMKKYKELIRMDKFTSFDR